jgi:hypothetical protein
MPVRRSIRTFSLANPIYVGATVTFYTVDGNGAKTSTKVTLYDASTGTGTLSNPQALDSDGKFSAPVYIEVPTIAAISGLTVDDHDTGIIFFTGIFRGDWATATVYYGGELVRDSTTGDVYEVATTHTSGTLATDVSNGDLVVILDLSVATDAAAAAVVAQTAAETAKTNAEAAETAAEAAQAAAETAQGLSEAAATAAALAAGTILFNIISNKSNADSPHTIVADTDDGTLFMCVMSAGNLTMTLPLVDTAGEGERYGFLRSGASNTLLLARSGSNTINGVAGDYTVSANDGELVVLIADENTPDNWIVKIWTQATAGNGLTKTGSQIDMNPIVLASIAIGDETTAIEAGTGIVTFHMGVAGTVDSVMAGLTTAQASGNIITFDINEGGVSILSTEITIDNTEKVSTTAVTPPVVSDTTLALGAEMTVDVDQIGDGTAAGGKIYVMGFPT